MNWIHANSRYRFCRKNIRQANHCHYECLHQLPQTLGHPSIAASSQPSTMNQHCISFAWAPNRTEFSWRWRAWNYSDSLIRTLTRTSRCWSSVATRGTGHQLLRHILLLFSTCISANTNASASAPVVTPIYTWSKHINDVKVPTGHQRQRFNSTSERRWVSGCVPTWDCKCLGTSMGKVAKS